MNHVFKALSDPTRRRVLQLLRKGPLSAGEISGHFDVAKPTMSAHFQVLLAADLIEGVKNGRNILYRLKLSVLEDALLGFADTVRWPAPAPKASRRTAAPGRLDRRPLRGEG